MLYHTIYWRVFQFSSPNLFGLRLGLGKFGKDVTLASHLSVLEKASRETLSLMFGEVSKRLPVLEKVVLAPPFLMFLLIK